MQKEKNIVRGKDVMTKLKDDGDYDRLRAKIIRKFKDNGELRSNIMSLVKQSKALNCPGVENMKPRQISDAIHQEIGDKLLSQVSDGVLDIIKSADGMKSEIIESVQSVYNQLSYPREKGNGESLSTTNSLLVPYESIIKGDAAGFRKTDGKPIEPPGFILTNPLKKSKNMHINRPNKTMLPPQNGKDVDGHKEDFSLDAPPGFSRVLKHKRAGPSTVEDPDVPPGFG